MTELGLYVFHRCVRENMSKAERANFILYHDFYMQKQKYIYITLLIILVCYDSTMFALLDEKEYRKYV